MGEVRDIDGGEVKSFEPDKQCIRFAESLLAKCKSGEVVQFAAAVIYRDRWMGTSMAGHMITHELLGAVTMLSNKLANSLNEDSD